MARDFEKCENCMFYSANGKCMNSLSSAYEKETSANNMCGHHAYARKADEAESQRMFDPVNHPSHYTNGKIEVIDYIEDKQFGYNLGNAIKYISRAGKKDKSKEIQDLEKAIWYIKRQISNLEKEKENK